VNQKVDKLADDYRLVRFRFADLLRTNPSFSGDEAKCR
jgi:hypothetical protein